MDDTNTCLPKSLKAFSKPSASCSFGPTTLSQALVCGEKQKLTNVLAIVLRIRRPIFRRSDWVVHSRIGIIRSFEKIYSQLVTRCFCKFRSTLARSPIHYFLEMSPFSVRSWSHYPTYFAMRPPETLNVSIAIRLGPEWFPYLYLLAGSVYLSRTLSSSLANL
jgi:hypothetical protein